MYSRLHNFYRLACASRVAELVFVYLVCLYLPHILSYARADQSRHVNYSLHLQLLHLVIMIRPQKLMTRFHVEKANILAIVDEAMATILQIILCPAPPVLPPPKLNQRGIKPRCRRLYQDRLHVLCRFSTTRAVFAQEGM